jgi:hypothetical protein
MLLSEIIRERVHSIHFSSAFLSHHITTHSQLSLSLHIHFISFHFISTSLILVFSLTVEDANKTIELAPDWVKVTSSHPPLYSTDKGQTKGEIETEQNTLGLLAKRDCAILFGKISGSFGSIQRGFEARPKQFSLQNRNATSSSRSQRRQNQKGCLGDVSGSLLSTSSLSH